MNDTVAVAIITGASTASSGMFGAWLSYRAGKRQAEVSIASAKTVADAEMARIEAENARLRQQHSEDERRHRQGTYHNVLIHVDRLSLMAGGYASVSEVEFDAWIAEMETHLDGLELFAPSAVRRTAQAFRAAVSAFLSDLYKSPRPTTDEAYQARFREVFYPAHDKAIVESARGELIEAMRRDVTVD